MEFNLWCSREWKITLKKKPFHHQNFPAVFTGTISFVESMLNFLNVSFQCCELPQWNIIHLHCIGMEAEISDILKPEPSATLIFFVNWANWPFKNKLWCTDSTHWIGISVDSDFIKWFWASLNTLNSFSVAASVKCPNFITFAQA